MCSGSVKAYSDKMQFSAESTVDLFFKNVPNPDFFVYFRSFHIAKTNLTINYLSIDGVLGTETWGDRMEDTD